MVLAAPVLVVDHLFHVVVFGLRYMEGQSPLFLQVFEKMIGFLEMVEGVYKNDWYVLSKHLFNEVEAQR